MSDPKLGERLTQSQEERNRNILQAWMPPWVVNTFVNFGQILQEFQKEDMSLLTLKGEDLGPAVIVGSGPSLDRTAPFLKDWKGAVFCAGSNAKVAARWDHKPEYVCVFDGGHAVVKQLEGYDWQGSTLLTHPAASPLVLQKWEWKKRYYLMMHPENQWFEQTNPIAFGNLEMYPKLFGVQPPFIKVSVLNGGCTVVNALQLAHFLGYDPIYLIGVDLGYPELKGFEQDKSVPHGKELHGTDEMVHRCTSWDMKDGKWVERKPWVGKIDRPIHESDNGVWTTEEQIDYKLALMAVWKVDQPTLFDCSDGIITEIPKLDFEEVVRNGGRGYKGLPQDEVVRITNDFLRRVQRVRYERDEHRSDEESREPALQAVGGDSGGSGQGRDAGEGPAVASD